MHVMYVYVHVCMYKDTLKTDRTNIKTNSIKNMGEKNTGAYMQE